LQECTPLQICKGGGGYFFSKKQKGKLKYNKNLNYLQKVYIICKRFTLFAKGLHYLQKVYIICKRFTLFAKLKYLRRLRRYKIL
jgi:ribosomal protein L36